MVDARTDVLDHSAITLVKKEVTAETALLCALPTVKHVVTQMVCVLVRADGVELIVLKNVSSHMERTARNPAVHIASIRSVTDSMEVVCTVARMEKIVSKCLVQLLSIHRILDQQLLEEQLADAYYL